MKHKRHQAQRRYCECGRKLPGVELLGFYYPDAKVCEECAELDRAAYEALKRQVKEQRNGKPAEYGVLPELRELPYGIECKLDSW